jgi:dTDP-4-amino-4,6-dideoxygalactose transaminase
MSKMLKLIEPMVGAEELELVKQVLQSGYLTEGRLTKEFEAKFAEFVGAKHAVATTSCTTALELCLRVLGVGRGDEVIVSDFTHPATACAVALVGAEPVLVDVELESYNIDLEQVRKAVSKKTKCIIPVSLFGHPLDADELGKLEEEHDLYVVEDAACSMGAEFKGKKTGVMADLTCFSFHPRKVVTTGEGGMITTQDDEFAESSRSLKNFGVKLSSGTAKFASVGTNYKLSDILAAVGLKQMEKAPQLIQKRIELARAYDDLLRRKDFMSPPTVRTGAKHTYQTYAPCLKRKRVRDKLISDLKARGVEAQIGTYALHLQPAFQHCRRVGKLRNSEALYTDLVALPMFHRMTLADQQFVVEEIADFVRQYDLE